MKKILLFIFSLLLLNASVNAQSLSGQMYGNNAGNSSMLSFSAAEPMVGGFPASGVGLLSGGQYAASASSFYSTVANGNWTDPLTWFGGVIPIAGVDVEIHHNVSLSSAVLTYNSITISSSGQLTMNDAYFALNASFTNDGTFNQNGSSNIDFLNAFSYTNNGTHNINTSSIAIYCNDAGSSFLNTVTGVLNINTSSSEIAVYGANTNFTNNGTFHIGDGATLSFANSATNATLTFASGSSNTFDDNSTIEITNTSTINKNTNLSFSNLILYNSTTFVGTGTTSIRKELTVSNNTAVSGTTLRYQTGSLLKIFTTIPFSTYDVPTSIWTPNVSYTSTNGVPYNVDFASSFGKIALAAGNDWRLGNSAVVSGGDTVIFRGNVELDSLALQAGSKVRNNGELKVEGSLIVDGVLYMQELFTEALKVEGDVLVGAGGDIVFNDRKLILNGTSNQQLINQGGTFTASLIEINNSGSNIILGSDLSLTANSGNLLDFLADATLDLNGFNINVLSTGGNIEVNDATVSITSSSASTINFGTGAYFFNHITGFVTIGSDVKLSTANAAGTLNLGDGFVDVDGTIEINFNTYIVAGDINYGAGSKIEYRHAGTRTVGGEWKSFTNGNSQPKGVSLYGSSTVTLLNFEYRVYEDLLISDGCTLNGTQNLKVRENVTVEPTGSLNLTTGANLVFYATSGSCEIDIQSDLSVQCAIEIEKTVGTVKLENSISMCAGVVFSGTVNLDLNGSHNIIIDAAGQIQNEGGGNGRIINNGNPSIGNGYVRFDVPAGFNTTLTNYGSLGIQLASQDVTGAASIKRFPKRQTGFGGNALGSLDRVFAVTIANASQITTIYSYFDEELNGINENVQNFYLWTSNTQNSGYVIDPGLNIQNPATNEIIAGFGSFNLGTTFIAANTQGLAPIITIADGNWSDGNTWQGGIPPTNAFGNPKAIIAHDVTLDQSYNLSQTINGLEINLGKTLTFATGVSLFVGDSVQNEGTLVMDANSILNLENLDHKFKNNGTITATSPSTVSFATNGKIEGTVTFSVLATNGDLDFSNATSINDSLVFKEFGFTVGADKPTYNSNSWLVYAGGTKDRGIEWSATSGAGYPYNVSLQNNTYFNLSGGSPTTNMQIAGNLVIDNNSELTMREGGDEMTSTLTVSDVSSTGTLNLSTVSGGGLVISEGNLDFSGSGDFFCNNSFVKFIGTAANQNISNPGYINISQLINNKSAGNIRLNSDLYLVGGGNVMSFTSNGGLDLNGHYFGLDLSIPSTISSSSTTTITSTGGESIFRLSEFDVNFTGNFVFGTDVNISTRNIGSAQISFANFFTVNGNLEINNTNNVFLNSPIYGPNSNLVYNTPTTYTSGNEWLSDVSTGAGVPSSVNILGNVEFAAGGLFKHISKDLSVASGINLDIGNVDVRLGGNLNNQGLIYDNGYVEMLGITNSNLFSSNPLSKLFINKTSGTVFLNSDITINNDLIVSTTLDLNGAKKISVPSSGNWVITGGPGTLINSSFSMNGYLEVEEIISSTGVYDFANGSVELDVTVGAGTIVMKRIPSYTAIVVSGRNAADNLLSFTTTGGNITGTLYLNHLQYQLNGSSAGSLKIWQSANGSNNSFAVVNSTDGGVTVETDSPLTFLNNSTTYITVANPAPVIVTKTTANNNGDWNVSSDWSPSGVPNPGDDIVINHTGFKMNIPSQTILNTYGTLTVNAGRSLIVQSGNDVYFSGSINNNGTITTQSNSTIHTVGATTFANNGTFTAISPSTFDNLDGGTLNGNATVFSGLTTGGVLNVNIPIVTIVDTLKFVDLGVWSGPTVPTYNTGSILYYSTSINMNRGLEWSSTIGNGYPYDVLIDNGTQLNLSGGQPTIARAISHKLTVVAATSANSTLICTGMQAPLTVRDIELVSNSFADGEIAVSDFAAGKLVLKDGDIKLVNGYNPLTQTSTNSVFEIQSATTTQHIDGNFYFWGKIIFNNSFDDIQTYSTSQLVLRNNIDFLTTKGIGANIDLVFDSPGIIVNLISGNRTISNGGFVTQFSSVTFSGAGTLNIGGEFTGEFGSFVNFGTGRVIINGNLVLQGNVSVTGYPTYTSNSLLYLDGRTAPGSEWQQGNGAAGVPYNVYINTSLSSHFVFPSGSYYVKKNLTYERSGNPLIAEPDLGVAGTNLFVAGDISNANYGRFAFPGTLTLNGTTNQSIELSNGNVPAPFNNITINKSAGNAIFTNNVTSLLVNGNLTFTSGNLDLNGKILDLGSTGTIVNENNNRRILSSVSGSYVITQRNFGNTISLGNSGNIGIIVNATAPIGLATIERYIEDVNNITAGNSVSRIYEIISPTLVVGSVALKYFSSELNGNAANSNMKVFRSSNFGNGYLPSPLTNNTYPAAPAAYTSAEQTSFSFPDASVSYFTAANTDLAYSGVYALPGPTFATLSDAFVQLNTSGIAGNVTINITPNYSEQLTQPVIFDFLNNPPNAGSTLTIQGDPDFPATFIAPLGGTLDRDAAIYILGTDYFTLQNFNLIANPSAANNNQRLEWGIAILKKTASNGCQNVNLNNWDINLSKLDTVATGIYIGNHTYNPLTPLAPLAQFNITNANGTHRDIRVKGSNIRNINRGIVHRGFSTTNSSFLDYNITIGDTLDNTQGNSFQNLGGIAYPATAIDIRHARDIIIGNNTIDNTANGGSLALERITGIELAGFTRGYNTIANNDISLKQSTSSDQVRAIIHRMNSSIAKTSIRKNYIHESQTGPNSTGNFYGISNVLPGVFNLLIDSNRIVNNTNINTSGAVFGIHNESNSERVLIYGDTIRNFISSTTANMYGIYNQSGADSNKVQRNVLVNLSKTGDGGFLYGYYNGSVSGMVAMGESGGSSVLAGLKMERVIENKIYSLSVFGTTKISGITSDGRNNFQKDVNNNVIRNLSSEDGELKGIDINVGQSINVNGNSLSNFNSNAIIKGISTTEGVVLVLDNDSVFDITQGGNADAYAIFHTQTTSGSHNKTFKNNDVLNIINSGGSGALYGILHTGSGTGSTAMTVNNNSIENINNSGSGAAYGILHTGSGSGGPHNINNTSNDIDNVTSSGAGSAYGILHTGSGSGGPHNYNFTTNEISNISNTGDGSAYGILHTGSGSGGPHNYVDVGNVIDAVSNSSAGESYGIYSESSSTAVGLNQGRTITSNTISNISNTGGGAAYGILHTGSGSGGPHNVNSSTNTIGFVSSNGAGSAYGILHTGSGSGGPNNFTNTSNNISNISNSGSGNAYGILHTGSGSGGPNNSSRVSNTISNITNSGSGNAYGILHTGSGSGGPHNGITRNNIITNLSTSAGSGACFGILHTGSGSGGPHNARISGNKLTNFSAASDSIEGVRIVSVDSISMISNKISEFTTVSGIIEGLSITSTQAGLKGLIANNVIGDFTTVSSNSNDAISGINVNGIGGNNLKFYYNTVYLAASSSGLGFGSSALTFAPAIPIDLRNNIFINKSNPASGGGVRVLNRTGALSPSFLNTSNNNAYLVSDSLSANNFIYTDGTNSYQDFGQYRSAVGFENASFAEDVAFIAVDGLDDNFLKIDGATSTRVESGGSMSNLGINTDAANNLRFGALAYAGAGTATDIGAYEGNYLSSFHKWVGLISNNWNVAGNWTGGVLPSSSDDVVIAYNTLPQPSLTLADAVCKNITFIHSGASVPTITIPATRKLTTNGDIILNGNFAGTGILELNSGVAQSINGIVNAVNVDVNNSNGVSIVPLGKLSVSRELALKSGILTTNSNNLVITYSGSSAGFINDFSGGYSGSISGGTRVQRYVNTPIQASHTISSPVTNGSTVYGNYNDNFLVHGAPSGYVYNSDPYITQPAPFPTTWWFDETLTAPTTVGWTNGIAKVMSPGIGIMATIPQNRLIDVVGTANTGSYNIPVTKTDDGLNLIGNPYPSPISLNAMLAANSATILPFVYVWNRTNYAAYSPGGPGIWVNNIGAGTNDRLAHSQGFFVISTVPGTVDVVMDNSMRTTNQSYVYFATPQNECRIQLKDGADSDELLIRTDGESNDEYDMLTDAKKLLNEPIYSSTIYSLSKDNFPLTINTIKDFEQDKVVPVSIKSKTSGSKELQFNELSSIDPSVNIYLEDASLGKFQDMRANSKYEVNLTEGNSGSRFYVHFSKKALITAANAESQSMIYSSQNKLFLDLTNSKGNSEVRIYNSLGQMVEYKNISSSNGGKAQLNLNNLSGAYVVQLTTNGEVKNEKVVFGN